MPMFVIRTSFPAACGRLIEPEEEAERALGVGHGGAPVEEFADTGAMDGEFSCQLSAISLAAET